MERLDPGADGQHHAIRRSGPARMEIDLHASVRMEVDLEEECIHTG
jgi:hypothetical protein